MEKIMISQTRHSARGNLIKLSILILIMLLTLYPIVELTRVIWVSGMAYYPHLQITFVVETAMMWALYLAIIPLLWRALK